MFVFLSTFDENTSSSFTLSVCGQIHSVAILQIGLGDYIYSLCIYDDFAANIKLKLSNSISRLNFFSKNDFGEFR